MSYVAVAGLIIAAAGTYAQADASAKARDAQQSAIQAAIQRNQQYQDAAQKVAMNRVQDYTTDNRQARQQQITQQATDQLIAPVTQAQPAMQDQAAVQGNVSSDYTAANAKATSDQMKSTTALAQILGKITGANRLRQQEALDMLSTGQQIDQLKNFSQGDTAASQIGIQQAGVPNGGQVLAGSLMQSLGSAAMAKGLSNTAWGGGTTTASGNGWVPADWKPTGTFKVTG